MDNSETQREVVIPMKTLDDIYGIKENICKPMDQSIQERIETLRANAKKMRLMIAQRERDIADLKMKIVERQRELEKTRRIILRLEKKVAYLQGLYNGLRKD